MAELIIIIIMIVLVIIHCPNGARTAGADRAGQSAVSPGAVDDAYTRPRLQSGQWEGEYGWALGTSGFLFLFSIFLCLFFFLINFIFLTKVWVSIRVHTADSNT